MEEKATVHMTAGKPVEIDVEYTNVLDSLEGQVLDRSNPSLMLAVVRLSS